MGHGSFSTGKRKPFADGAPIDFARHMPRKPLVRFTSCERPHFANARKEPLSDGGWLET